MKKRKKNSKEVIKAVIIGGGSLQWNCPSCNWVNWGFPSLYPCQKCNQGVYLDTCPECKIVLVRKGPPQDFNTSILRCPKCNKRWDIQIEDVCSDLHTR